MIQEDSFSLANKKVHSVEKQWHWSIMTRYGYKPTTKEGIGLVRLYEYKNEITSHKITVCTGASADYFCDDIHQISGFWSDLEPHLKKIMATK